MNLSILIPTVDIRYLDLEKLLKSIQEQLDIQLLQKIEVCVFRDNFEHTIGEKRNTLCKVAQGKFLVFVDDDDEINPRYCKKISQIIDNKDVDYIGYRMAREFDGIKHKPEYRSIYYKQFYSDDNGSYRNVSHTNPIKTEIAQKFEFPKWNSGEDNEWCEQVYKSGLIRSEHFLCESMYIQKYNSNKSLSKKSKDSGQKDMFDKQATTVETKYSQFGFVKWIG